MAGWRDENWQACCGLSHTTVSSEEQSQISSWNVLPEQTNTSRPSHSASPNCFQAAESVSQCLSSACAGCNLLWAEFSRVTISWLFYLCSNGGFTVRACIISLYNIGTIIFRGLAGLMKPKELFSRHILSDSLGQWDGYLLVSAQACILSQAMNKLIVGIPQQWEDCLSSNRVQLNLLFGVGPLTPGQL